MEIQIPKTTIGKETLCYELLCKIAEEVGTERVASLIQQFIDQIPELKGYCRT